MRVLAIETATSVCSVALFENDRLIDHAHHRGARGHAERLVPMIAALADGGRADRILIDVGPGSFTGVRIGLAAARALGFAWTADVRGFGALALIAAADGWQDDTAVVIEGGHGALFCATYGSDGRAIMPPCSLPFAEAVAAVTAPRVIGNAAARLNAARGFGESVDVEPDARHALAVAAEYEPAALYLRGADARPMRDP